MTHEEETENFLGERKQHEIAIPADWTYRAAKLQAENAQLRSDLKLAEGVALRLWDTMRAIAVDGLGLSDPDSLSPAQAPKEWQGLFSEKVAALRRERDSLREQLDALGLDRDWDRDKDRGPL